MLWSTEDSDWGPADWGVADQGRSCPIFKELLDVWRVEIKNKLF